MNEMKNTEEQHALCEFTMEEMYIEVIETLL